MVRVFGIILFVLGIPLVHLGIVYFQEAWEYLKKLPSKRDKIIYLFVELDSPILPLLVIIGCLVMIIGILLCIFPSEVLSIFE